MNIVAGLNTVNVTMQKAGPPTSLWLPTADAPIHWQWQLDQFRYPADVIPNVTVYDIDGFTTSAQTVTALHALDCRVIAYFSFGSWEDWRPDAGQFPSSVKGNNNGWPGEKWLDIRSPIVRQIMAARIDLAVSKGFDAIEPDNIDGYSNSTGFPLTAADQLDFNRWIASECHAQGLSVGLKNDIDQCAQLVSYFDWVLNEECNRYQECGGLDVFVALNKAAFQVEYRSGDMKCSQMTTKHINSMRRNLDLTGGGVRIPCIPDTQNTW